MKNSKHSIYSMVIFITVACAGLVLPSVINGQKTDSESFLSGTRLIESFDFSKEEWFQFGFNGRSEIFLVTRDRATRQWYYRKGDVRKEFFPCPGSTYGGSGSLHDSESNVAVACRDLNVEVWDLQSGVKRATLEVSKNTSLSRIDATVSKDGRRVLLRYSGPVDYADLFDGTTGKRIARLRSGATSCDCIRDVRIANGFSPDGKIAVVTFGAMTFLFDAETGKLVSRLVDKDLVIDGLSVLTHRFVVQNILFNKSGNILITSAYDGAKAWNVETGEVLQRFEQSRARRNSGLALSPDEKSLVTGGADEHVRLWDIGTGRLLWKSKDVKDTIVELYFSPNGSRILSQSWNRLTLLDAKTGSLLEHKTFGNEYPRIRPDWKQIIHYDKKTKRYNVFELEPGM